MTVTQLRAFQEESLTRIIGKYQRKYMRKECLFLMLG